MSPGKNITCAKAAFGLLFLLTLLPAHAILPRRKPQLEDFDKRARAAEAQVPADKQEGLRHLKELAPNSKVDWDPVLGTPHWIRAQAGFLTGKAGSGKGISKAVDDQIPINDPDRTLKGFLNEHKRLFGHDASALAGTRKTREFVAEHNGLRTVVFQQEFEKIRVYEALLVAHTTKDGELVSVSSHFLSDLATAARKGMPQRNAAKSISPESAVAFAARAAGEEFSADQVQTGKTPAQGNEKHFSAPGLKGDTTASLVWL